MIHFSYSFCMAMLHSFWQAGLIILLYVALNKIIHKNNAPLAKRNFLYVALFTQLSLFTLTFFIYFFDTRSTGNLTTLAEGLANYVGIEKIQLITPWIFNFYIFIIVYKLIKAIYTWYQFKQQFKTGLQKPVVELKLFTELKAHQFGIKRKVKLWLSTNIQTPVTFGFFKPVILLPVALVNSISVQQAETLILHELTHIRTNDYLLNWFLLFTDTVFFYNPFITSLCNRIRMEREKNCDLAVIAFQYPTVLYAETLLQAERMKQPALAFQLAAVSRKKQLLNRIHFFSENKKINDALKFNIIVPLVGLGLLLFLSASILFNSGSSTAGLNTTATMPNLPFSNHLVSDVDFGKNIIPEQKGAELLAANNEILQPVIENQIKPSESLTETIQLADEINKQANEIARQTEESFAMPVTINENDASRQIIIKEESSGSKSSSVKVYYLSFENGQWILQPEWIVTAKEIVLDSLSRKIDSLQHNLKRIFPAQQ